MLSEENISKLCMTGIYRCDPVKEWLPSYKRDTPYHCCNWTFKVRKSEDNYFMIDTHWSTYWPPDSMIVQLTDKNFDRFEFLFDMNEVTRVSPPDFYDYNEKDRWHIALDSGGYRFSKYYFVRKDAKKDKVKLLNRLNEELDSLMSQVEWKKKEIEKAKMS